MADQASFLMYQVLFGYVFHGSSDGKKVSIAEINAEWVWKQNFLEIH